MKSPPRVLVCLAVALAVGVALGASRPGAFSTSHGPARAVHSAVVSTPPSTASPEHAALATSGPGLDQQEHGEAEGGHQDPFSIILLELALVILAALVGRGLAGRWKQPSVLGELVIGVILGNVGFWLGAPLFVLIMQLSELRPITDAVWLSGVTVQQAAAAVYSPEQLAPGGIGYKLVQVLSGPEAPRLLTLGSAIWMFSNLGVILLLLMVGLESSVEEMLAVGTRATLVAIVGVVAPFLLGLAAMAWLMPEASSATRLFVAATFTATSVGITARVFKDLAKIHTQEAKVILGAAVIDDILGLIILAVVAGIAVTGSVELSEVVRITVLSVIFLGAVVLFGERFVRWTIPLVSRLDRANAKLLFPLTLTFVMAWIASQIELATIVGAFAAGLILNDEHFAKHTDNKITMQELIAPLEAIFAPVFFVLMGMQVNLSSFLQPGALWLALAFIVAAIIGKLVAGFPAGRWRDRLSVGIGMVPRGEVGLIFASVGKGLGVVSDVLFSAIVMMVIVTTLITPLALRWSLFRERPTHTPGPAPA